MGTALDALPERGWARVRELLNWTVIRGENWEGQPVRPDGTVILTPLVVASLTDAELADLIKDPEDFEMDGHLTEIKDGIERGWHDAERGAAEDAYYTGYTEAVESVLGGKPVWMKVDGKDKMAFLIPWETIQEWLVKYYDNHSEHFGGDFEDLVISYADRAQPSEDYYATGQQVVKRFQEDGWSYGLDQVSELDPPEPVMDPQQSELFEPEASYAPVPQPPPAPGLGESLLLEGYKYACALIELPPEHADFLLGWGKANIPDDVLYVPPGDDTMGRELEAHVTVKYGITLNEVPHELHQIMEQTPAFPVYLGAVSLFQQADYDVVKLAVESPWLRQLNARITKTLPCEGDKHPTYNPHTTLAYVKKGSCDHLVGQDPFTAEGSPGAEFTAYGMLYKGASELEDDPLRVKDHLLFNKTKKPEPPLEDMPMVEALVRERVRAAAMRHKSLGVVTVGATHSEAMEQMIDHMRRKGVWNFTWDELEQMPDKQRNRYWNQMQHGFWTTKERFVDKDEASRISGIKDIHGEDIQEALSGINGTQGELRVQLRTLEGPKILKFPALVSRNSKPGEKPFRLSWFKMRGRVPTAHGHVSVSKAEAKNLVYGQMSDKTWLCLVRGFGAEDVVFQIRAGMLEAVDPKEFISQVPEPKKFYVKIAWSETGTGVPDIYVGEWGKMSVERPEKPFPESFDHLESIKQWISSRYGSKVLELLRVEPVYEAIPAGVGPFETLPFPSNPRDLIPFLRNNRKRPQKTLL